MAHVYSTPVAILYDRSIKFISDRKRPYYTGKIIKAIKTIKVVKKQK